MSLTPTERVALERRLGRLRRHRRGATDVVALLLAAVPAAGVLAALVGVGVAYAALADQLDTGLERISRLADRQTFESVKIYDRNGVLLREIFTEGRRTWVPLAEVPLVLRQATIAVEDATFYGNPGVDPLALMRAAGQRALFGRIVTGGSTITQQFARHVAFSDEERLSRSYARKAKEIVLALVMTQRYSKNEVLEGYLNEIYYGNLAYGVEAASQTIFGKPVSDIDVAEAALLAGLPQAPLAYDPLSPDPETRALVKARQRTVLNLMVKSGFLSPGEAQAAARRKLSYRSRGDEVFLAPHFVVFVEKVLEDALGSERLARGGLEVTTTLDLALQATVERIVREHVDALVEAHHLTNGAVVVTEPRTGQILAMVGSKDYWDDDIDGRVNVALRPRQPGSSIKPVTYVTAFEQGIQPATVLWDVPMKRDTPQGVYEPVNYDERFHGPVRLRTALANSYNIPALKLLERVGVREMIHTANRLGITTLDAESGRYGLSITLGGGEVTLLDMTTAFGALANGGGVVQPNPVLRIRTSAGEVLYDRLTDLSSRVPSPGVDPAAAFMVTDILSDSAARVPEFGTRSPLNVSRRAAAKTGTTNDFRDNWTVGYSPNVVVGVWAGNSDNSRMRDTSGVTGAAPIWHDVMESLFGDYEGTVRQARGAMGFPMRDDFDRPEGIVERPVCVLESLNFLGPSCPQTRPELFRADPDDEESSPAPVPTPPGTAFAYAAGDDWVVTGAVAVPAPPRPALEGEEDQPRPWPNAQLCLPAGPGRGTEKTFAIAVLPLPIDPDERASVQVWSLEHGWPALEPSIVCTSDMAAVAIDLGAAAAWAGAAPGLAIPRAEYRLGIAPGTTLTTTTTLTGTVLFNQDLILYYKVELGAAPAPTEWITIGTTHRSLVQDGPIEVLDAPSLPAGDYVVRLVLVRRDGNFLRPPFSVPIHVSH